MTQHCKANPCCGDVPCSGVPLPQDGSGLTFHNKECADQIKAGATSVNQAREMLEMPEVPSGEKPKDTGDNFLTLMMEMAGVVGRFRERIVAEGQTFAKDFATLAPYMQGLSSTQEQIFLSAFAAAMQEANSHMQKVVGATFETL